MQRRNDLSPDARRVLLTIGVAVMIVAAPVDAQAQSSADHVTCYKVKDPLKLKGPKPAWLDLDSAHFGNDQCRIVGGFRLFCVPVSTTVTAPIERKLDSSGYSTFQPDSGNAPPLPSDQMCYKIKCQGAGPADQEITDQFASRTVEKLKPFLLCGPAVQGTCTTPTPDNCGGFCTSTASDDENCGVCGNACGSSGICLGGVCELSCAAGHTECGGTCVDTETDPSNCGSCGVACDPSAACDAGVCELGTASFTVAPGTDVACPGSPETVAGSLALAQGMPNGSCNLTPGNFTPGPLELQAGAPDADGRAPLTLRQPVVLRAGSPGNAYCLRLENDATASSFVDCDGGSSANVLLQLDSNRASAPPAPEFDPTWLSVPDGSDDGTGAVVLHVLLKLLYTESGSCPSPGASAWDTMVLRESVLVTGTATTQINDRRRCQGFFGVSCPADSPYRVSLDGTNLSCASWTSPSGGRLVAPLALLDSDFDIAGTGDIAAILRLND